MTLFRRIYRLIPPDYRRRGWSTVLLIPFRAFLDLVGVAALLPLLMLILGGGAESHPLLAACYRLGGFSSPQGFAAAVCGGVIVLLAVKNGLTLLIARRQNRYLLSLYRHFSAALFETYHRRGLPFSNARHSAELSYEVNQACYGFAMSLLAPLLNTLGETVFLVLLLTALLVYAPFAALLLAACFIPVAWGYMRLVRGRLARFGAAESEARSRQSRLVQETFRGHAEIEVNRAFPLVGAQFGEGLDAISRARIQSDTIQRLPGALTEIAVAGGMAFLLLPTAGDASRPMLFGVFAVAALRLLPSVRALLGGWAQVRSNRHTADLIARALHKAPDTGADPADTSPLGFERAITLDRVTFAHDDGPPVIDGFSLTIRRGDRLAVRGPSGAGKSTLLGLLLGLYVPCSGTICVDGTPLTPATRRRWQNTVGYVPQEVFLLSGTLAANIALGQRAIDRAKVRQVLQQVGLGDWLTSLPRGIDTPTGEAGARLSGGQKQRIGIARALYRDAGVLVLDEATSALDRATEHGIIVTINALFESRPDLTLIMVSHRDAALACCGRVLDMTQPTGR